MLGRALANGRPEIDKICLQSRRLLERALANGRAATGHILAQRRRSCERALADGRAGVDIARYLSGASQMTVPK